MVTFYLTATLLTLLLISWRIRSWSPTSPSVVSVSVFLASTILLTLGPKSLHKELSEHTALTIILALMAFFIGEIIALSSVKTKKPFRQTDWKKPIEIGTCTYINILFFSIVTLVWSYYSIKEMATAVGYREGEHLLIQYARLAVLQNEMRPSTTLILFSFMLLVL